MGIRKDLKELKPGEKLFLACVQGIIKIDQASPKGEGLEMLRDDCCSRCHFCGEYRSNNCSLSSNSLCDSIRNNLARERF